MSKPPLYTPYHTIVWIHFWIMPNFLTNTFWNKKKNRPLANTVVRWVDNINRPRGCLLLFVNLNTNLNKLVWIHHQMDRINTQSNGLMQWLNIKKDTILLSFTHSAQLLTMPNSKRTVQCQQQPADVYSYPSYNPFQPLLSVDLPLRSPTTFNHYSMTSNFLTAEATNSYHFQATSILPSPTTLSLHGPLAAVEHSTNSFQNDVNQFGFGQHSSQTHNDSYHPSDRDISTATGTINQCHVRQHLRCISLFLNAIFTTTIGLCKLCWCKSLLLVLCLCVYATLINNSCFYYRLVLPISTHPKIQIQFPNLNIN